MTTSKFELMHVPPRDLDFTSLDAEFVITGGKSITYNILGIRAVAALARHHWVVNHESAFQILGLNP